MRFGRRTAPEVDERVDLVLIGGGIMSATLASMVAVLEPSWRILVLERARQVAGESSGAWNNAGTGHSGYCELNYMPDPADGAKAHDIAQQFQTTLRWWARLADEGVVAPTGFMHSAPHMTAVFGDRDVDYLRRRFRTLSADPLFAEMEFTDDRRRVAEWAPLLMDGRPDAGPIAATRHPAGVDVDFGALTRQMLDAVVDRGGAVRTGWDVRGLLRRADGGWTVRGRRADTGRRFAVAADRVFVGAGGLALRLMQRARIREVKGYAVLPVGAAFFRTADPEIVARHETKVYGQAALGAPPMSVPHLDRRFVDGRAHLMFGPYATFSTRLLKGGSLADFFTTLRWDNLHVIAAAMLQNLGLVRYLIGQLASSPRRKFRALQTFCPTAEFGDWELVAGGQRAQLVTPHPRRVGELQQGTELVIGADGTVAGLLGASPGASTAVPIMLDLLDEWIPDASRGVNR